VADSNAPPPSAPQRNWRARLRRLYLSGTPAAYRFRLGIIGLEALSLGWIVAVSFFDDAPWVFRLDMVLGAVLLVEFALRIAIARRPWHSLLSLGGLIDLVAILSLLFAPLLQGALAFLRGLRFLRLLDILRLLTPLYGRHSLLRQREEALRAGLQLAVFLFVMSGLVYESQHRHNDAINNYMDALYFTVTALTTTGFGDITLNGTDGRLLSVVIMLSGITLFLRLAQALVQPLKVRFPCPTCNLQRHEPDAVHCKACGTSLRIPDEGW
jgi:voltage-gated potassium channel